MHQYRACFFDFDMTMADSAGAILACFQYTLKKHGFALPADSAIYHTIGHPLPESLVMLTGAAEDAVTAMRRTYFEIADQIMAKRTVMFPETLPVFAQLHANGIRTAVISSKAHGRIEETLRMHCPALPLDCLIGAEDVEAHKPAPDGILAAARLLHVDPADVLYIGDSTVDAAAAQNAGAAFAAVTTGFTAAAEFAAYPCVRVMRSLSELPETAGL